MMLLLFAFFTKLLSIIRLARFIFLFCESCDNNRIFLVCYALDKVFIRTLYIYEKTGKLAAILVDHLLERRSLLG